jgi:hypothetical protein
MRVNVQLFIFRFFAAVFCLSVIVSCTYKTNNKNTSPAQGLHSSIPDSIVNFLIRSASEDFYAHQPPVAVGFRNVRIGYLQLTGSEKQFILCGEFLAQENMDKESWEPFATIKTDPYEQYTGNQTTSFCENTNMVWPDDTDYSAELKKQLELMEE